jgi:hypothetical protein
VRSAKYTSWTKLLGPMAQWGGILQLIPPLRLDATLMTSSQFTVSFIRSALACWTGLQVKQVQVWMPGYLSRLERMADIAFDQVRGFCDHTQSDQCQTVFVEKVSRGKSAAAAKQWVLTRCYGISQYTGQSHQRLEQLISWHFIPCVFTKAHEKRQHSGLYCESRQACLWDTERKMTCGEKCMMQNDERLALTIQWTGSHIHVAPRANVAL